MKRNKNQQKRYELEMAKARDYMADAGRGSGVLIVELNGEVVSRSENIWTDAGKNYAAIRTGTGTSLPDVIDHMAIGEGSATPVATQTTFPNQLFRKSGTPTVAGAVITFVVTFDAGEGTGTVRQAGVLNAATGGTLYAYGNIASPPVKGQNDTVTITWTFTFS